MKKIITTLYSDKMPIRYYVEISEDRSSFNFVPCLSNREYTEFTLYLKNGELKVKGKVPKKLFIQAKEEITSLLSINLLEKINLQIRDSFLY
jgi:hypothetical protein